MDRKTTGDLKSELKTQPNIEAYIKENEAHFIQHTVPELLVEFYERRSVSKADLARKSGMSEVYLHQVFAGRRRPSRDRLLCLCIGLCIGIEDVQWLLKQSGYAQLYPKIRREAIICYGIVHGSGLNWINDSLFAENEKTLC